ncbi:MAG: phospholipase D-like domain-containing protein [Planctomycetota bacterium]
MRGHPSIKTTGPTLRGAGPLPLIDPDTGMSSAETVPVWGSEHLERVIDAVCGARVSVAVMTADVKGMLVPVKRVPARVMGAIRAGEAERRKTVRKRGAGIGRGDAVAMLEVMGGLARLGVEVRVLHGGVPSRAAWGVMSVSAKGEMGSRPTDSIRGLQDGAVGVGGGAGGAGGGVVMRRCVRQHAKVVVVDAAAAYIGSANLTGAGLGAKADRNRNFEMGVWTIDAAMVESALERFNAVWEGGFCDGCGRRDVCPVPLEEVRLAG